jgi:hypothetical protein
VHQYPWRVDGMWRRQGKTTTVLAAAGYTGGAQEAYEFLGGDGQGVVEERRKDLWCDDDSLPLRGIQFSGLPPRKHHVHIANVSGIISGGALQLWNILGCGKEGKGEQGKEFTRESTIGKRVTRSVRPMVEARPRTMRGRVN